MEAGDLDKSFRKSFDGSLRLMEHFLEIGDVFKFGLPYCQFWCLGHCLTGRGLQIAASLVCYQVTA